MLSLKFCLANWTMGVSTTGCVHKTEEEVICPVKQLYYIFRIRVQGRWCLHDDNHVQSRRMTFDSFTRAFLVLRQRMTKRGESPLIRRVLSDDDDEGKGVRIGVTLADFMRAKKRTEKSIWPNSIIGFLCRLTEDDIHSAFSKNNFLFSR